MSATLLLDFIRLLMVFLAVYVALPGALSVYYGRTWRVCTRWDLVISAFVRIVLFFQLLALALGYWQLCLFGTILLAYLLWLLASLLMVSEKAWLWNAAPWRAAFQRLLVAIEERELPVLPLRIHQIRTRRFSWFTLLAGALGCMLLIERSWYSLGNFRFQSIETYTRSLNLHSLTSGRPWLPDGSVAFLAPLKFFSGLDATSVIRHSGPLFAVLLVLAAGYCAWSWTHSRFAFLLAAGAAAAYPILAASGSAGRGELSADALAALFWVLAAARVVRSRFDAAAAAIVALLIYRQWTWEPLLYLGIISASALLSPVARRIEFLRLPAAAGGAAALLLILIHSMGYRPPDGPYQYEAAARTAHRIAAGERRNSWMIVSPVHEVALTHGRGWHLELAEFVSAYGPHQVASRHFRFPYPVEQLFVFVEKQALLPGGASLKGAGRYPLSGDWEPVILAYNNPLSRASLQFKAARLMAAFLSSHPDTEVYYEDERLVVYRIWQPQPAATVPASPRS